MLLLFLRISTASSAFAASNPCDLKKIDDCVKGFLPYSINTKEAITEQELDQRCLYGIDEWFFSHRKSTDHAYNQKLETRVFTFVIFLFTENPKAR